jgi:acyl carrier protein
MTEPDQDGAAVVSQIDSFVRDQFGAPDPSRIGQDTELFREGIVDSMGILTLMRFLEQAFQIQIEPREMLVENFATIAAMRDFVLGKKS